MYYYNVGIFYSRKDSFNIPIKTNIELDVDDLDEFANAVVELGLISKEDALQIVFAEEISEHEYEDMV